MEIAIREIPNSSGPSIEKDAWRAINLSLTRDLKWSKGEFVRIHETRIHDWITTVDLREIWTVNCPGRNRHFGNREDEGGKSFDLVTHEIPIHEMPMRSESSYHGESGPLDHELGARAKFLATPSPKSRKGLTRVESDGGVLLRRSVKMP